MYSLEYRVMVQVLRQLNYSGEFHADVPSQPALRGGGRAVLLVERGSVISCLILNSRGEKVYEHAKAQRLLPTLGILDWKYISSTSAMMINPTVPATTSVAKSEERSTNFIPRRLLVAEGKMRSWSLLQRSVYFLADGTHSIAQIATLLSQPVITIIQIIRDFEASGVIERS
jgi:hypothetical protein